MSEVKISHPVTGDEHTVTIPDDHNGARVKVEFPAIRDEGGNVVHESCTAYTEGWDPAERALSGERPVVACPHCGEPQVLTETDFACAACGTKAQIKLVTSSESGEGESREHASAG